MRQKRATSAILHYAEVPDERTRDARDRFGFIIQEAFKNPGEYDAAIKAQFQRRQDTAEFLERMANAYGATFLGDGEPVKVHPRPAAPELAPDVTYQAHVGEM